MKQVQFVISIVLNGIVMDSELDDFSVSCAIFIGFTEVVVSSLICLLRDDDLQRHILDDSFTFFHSDTLFGMCKRVNTLDLLSECSIFIFHF